MGGYLLLCQDEHLVLTAGLNGSQRQQLQIRTGDYQGPRLRSGPSGSAWPFGDLRRRRGRSRGFSSREVLGKWADARVKPWANGRNG